MRQWDTKRQFKPQYARACGAILLGPWRSFKNGVPSYLEAAQSLSDLCLSVAIFICSPVILPVCLFIESRLARSRRLAYLRSNRAADEDI